MVDDAHRVIHLSENAGRLMQPAGGPMNSDIGEMVRPELRFELRSALHRAFERRQPTLTLPIMLRFNGTPRRVLFLVKPITENDDSEPHTALVVFVEGEAIENMNVAPDQHQATSDTVRRLTEELETSKEELQTVNNELQAKLDIVSRAHSDLQYLMAATDVATLFFDTSLHIKRFTDRLTDLFSVTPADEGRPITDFSHQLEYDDLVKDVHAVLADLAPIHREVRSRDGRWYDVRIRAYRTVDNKIDGVVITFVNITERKKIERKLQQRHRLVDLSHDAIFAWDVDATITEWNRGTTELYGYSAEEAVGENRGRLLATAVPGSSFDELKATLLRDGRWAGKLQEKAKDGHSLTVESRLQLDSIEDQRMVLEIAREVAKE